jgi:hypothetical protein
MNAINSEREKLQKRLAELGITYLEMNGKILFRKEQVCKTEKNQNSCNNSK